MACSRTYSTSSSLSTASNSSSNFLLSEPMHQGQSILCMSGPAPFFPFLRVLVVYSRLQVQHIDMPARIEAAKLNQAYSLENAFALFTMVSLSFLEHSMPG